MINTESTFEFGLFFWQVFIFAILITVIYFLVKLLSRMLKYYKNK